MTNLVELRGENKTSAHVLHDTLCGIHRCLAQLILESPGSDELTDWEAKFLQTILVWEHETITEKQWAVLGRLAGAVSRRERRMRRPA